MHLDILFSVGKIRFFVCNYVICCITLRWSKNSENVVIVCPIHGNRKFKSLLLVSFIDGTRHHQASRDQCFANHRAAKMLLRQQRF